MNRAVFKKLLQRKTLLWIAGGLAAAWLLAWYAVPWLVPLPEGLLHPEERGAMVLDRDGGRIATLPGPDYYHTEPVRLREVPDMLLKATLAAEDKRFFSHGGADFLALARAAAANAAGGEVVSGASHHHPAARQECQSSRTQEPVDQGPGVFPGPAHGDEHEQGGNSGVLFQPPGLRQSAPGAAAAARFYFGREMAAVPAECACWRGCLQGPSFLNPLRHPERALERRNRVLRRLEEEGMFPADMVNRALQEPLFSAGMEEGRQPAAPHVTAALMHAGRTGRCARRWTPPCSAARWKS